MPNKKLTTTEFIENAQNKHGERYDYSKIIYTGCRNQVIIICKTHNIEFSQRAAHHLDGRGCQLCATQSRSEKIKSDVSKFVADAMKIHGNRYNYSRVVYNGSKKNVTIICNDHGEFEQMARTHIRGSGCAICVGGGRKSNTQEFIKKAINVHADRYDYSAVDYIGRGCDVVITCQLHGEFEQSPTAHLRGSGCPNCGGKMKLSTSVFIERAMEIHHGLYKYDKVNYIRCDKKVEIICKKHGVFLQTPQHHLEGFGCSACGDEFRGLQRRSDTTTFIKQATEIHGNTYDYSLVEYVKMTEKVIIVCPFHKAFEQTPASHLSGGGSGCSKCSRRLSMADFIERAMQAHNTMYDYSKVIYNGCDEKVIIRCHKHGYFKQSPFHHFTGQGCPKCANKGFSKMQIHWLEFLEIFNNISIQHIGNSPKEHRIKSTRWHADGYHNESNTIYEFHGDFYHGNPKKYDPDYVNPKVKRKMKTLYAQTVHREQRIKELGYQLEVMWESDWININKSIRKLQKAFRSTRE